MPAPPHAFLAAVLLLAACGGKPPPAPVVTLVPPRGYGPDDALGDHGRRLARRRPMGGPGAGRRAGGHRRRRQARRDAARRGPGQGAAQSVDRCSARGDTLYVGDWGLRQTSRWTLDGRFAGAIPAPDALRGVLPRAPRRRRPLLPRARARGRAPTARATATPPPWCGPRPALDRADTLARLAPLDIAEVAGDAGRRFERRVFSGADQWGALPDGSLWVARVYENRVDWRDPDGQVDPGRAAAGPRARGDPLRPRAVPAPVSARAPQHGRAAAVRPVKPPFEAGLTGAGDEVVAGEEPRARSIRAAATTWWTARAGCGRRSACRAGGVSSPWRRAPCWSPSRPAAASGCSDSPCPRRPRAHEFRSRPFVRFRRSSRMKLAASLCTLVLLTAGCTPAESQGGLTLEKKLPVTLRAAEQRGRAGRRPRGLRGHQGEAVPRRRPPDRQGGHARHPGGFADQERAAGAVQVPRLGGAPGGRHGRAGGLQRAAHHALERGRASRSACCRSSRSPGTAPVLVYDTVGHGYKVDYQAVLGGAEPGSTVAAGQRAGAAHRAQDRQGGYGGATSPRPNTATRCSASRRSRRRRCSRPNDFFGVLPNGTAWLARGHENRVDWRSPDRHVDAGQAARVYQDARHPGRPRPGAGPGARARQAVRHAAGPARSSIRSPTPSRRSISRWAGRTARSGCSGRARRRMPR